MPLVQSQVHPYYVIVNALPKLQSAPHLTVDQAQLILKLTEITALWKSPRPEKKAPSGSGARRGGGGKSGGGGQGGGGGDDDKGGGGGGGGRGRGAGGKRAPGAGHKAGGSSRGGRVRGRGGNSLGGKGAMIERDESATKGQKQDEPQGHDGDAGDKSYQGLRGDLGRLGGPLAITKLPPSPPISTSNEDGQASKSLSNELPDDTRNDVFVWREQVVKAGPSEPVHQKVVWSVQERARQPYKGGDWGDWKPKWNSPPDRSKFSSNDWAVYWKVFVLPRHRH
jgi:hypothetical protein